MTETPAVLGHDARGIANLILDRADALNLSVSNMALNKIIFFAHAWFLVTTDRQLVVQSFEAWQHGPLVQDVYHSFKKFGDRPITERANRLDTSTAQYIKCESALPRQDLALFFAIVDRYAPIPASALRNMTHVRGGPWDRIWHYEGASNPGMVISNGLIAEYYRTKLPIGAADAYSKST